MGCSAGLILQVGWRVPASMRWSYAERIYETAEREYVPQRYPGKMVLIEREQLSASFRGQWEKLVVGGVTVHTVRSPSHVDLGVGEDARQWAEILRCYLEKADRKGTLAVMNTISP